MRTYLEEERGKIDPIIPTNGKNMLHYSDMQGGLNDTGVWKKSARRWSCVTKHNLPLFLPSHNALTYEFAHCCMASFALPLSVHYSNARGLFAHTYGVYDVCMIRGHCKTGYVQSVDYEERRGKNTHKPILSVFWTSVKLLHN